MSLKFIEAAEKILAEAKEPLHYVKITRRALAQNILTTAGKTPEMTMNARIVTDIKSKQEESKFVKIIPGVFALREWDLPKNVAPREKRPKPERKSQKTQYGDVINFRGMLHAPLNEQGVVYLFGMLSKELDLIIEAVRTGFPDCEGKRKLPNGHWERVKIEFEYMSSNFLTHGHDSALCDVIVCWEHDWKECPLEVIELREIVKRGQ